jgi:hypothetical protein
MQAIMAASATIGLSMKITSAYPLDRAQRDMLSQAGRT